ncbi:MAG: hypothetical protein O6830_05280 [Candidatus Dadabacteria bacterium]|nr:hypothetical protein [Candidatus Dadabacteria bacterium]
MPVQANISNKQSFEVIVQGGNRMIICAGKLDVSLIANDNTADGTGTIQKETFTALIDPQLGAGQFKRALAVASFADIGSFDSDSTQRDGARWVIEDVQADFDDESGQVELRVSVMVNSMGVGSQANIQGILFQVTTIASVQGQ